MIHADVLSIPIVQTFDLYELHAAQTNVDLPKLCSARLVLCETLL